MDSNRFDLMAQRDAALAAGNIALYQSLTVQIAALPMKGVAAPTAKSIARYVGGKR